MTTRQWAVAVTGRAARVIQQECGAFPSRRQCEAAIRRAMEAIDRTAAEPWTTTDAVEAAAYEEALDALDPTSIAD